VLVLSRRESQSIRVSDEIVITVVSIRGSAVRLGISAPREVSIARSEVADANGCYDPAMEHPELSKPFPPA
jgi:carbon storage regulator